VAVTTKRTAFRATNARGDAAERRESGGRGARAAMKCERISSHERPRPEAEGRESSGSRSSRGENKAQYIKYSIMALYINI